MDKSHRTIILVLVCAGYFVNNAGTTIPAAIYPQSAMTRGFVEGDIGYMFAALFIVSFITTLIVGQNMENHKKSLMIVGICIYSVSTFCLGLVDWIEDPTMYMTISILTRVFAGLGIAMYQVPGYSYIPLLFPDDLESKVAYIELSLVLGLSAGFVIGSAFYAIGGFLCPFALVAVVEIFMMFAVIKYIPNKQDMDELVGRNACTTNKSSDLEVSVDKNQNREKIQIQSIPSKSDVKSPLLKEKQQDNSFSSSSKFRRKLSHHSIGDQKKQNQVNNKISYYKIFTQRKIISTYIGLILTLMGVVFIQPTFCLYMESEYTVGAARCGYLYAISLVVYCVFAPIIGYLIKDKLNKKLSIAIGLIFSGIFFILTGPDRDTGIIPRVWITTAAMALTQYFAAHVFIPMIPEFIDNLVECFPEIDESYSSDISSALYNSGYAIAETIAPISGTILAQHLGFQRASAVFGMSEFLYGVVYLFLSGYIFKCCKSNGKGNKTAREPGEY